MADLDVLLDPDTQPSMSEVADALQEGYDEHWQVELIRKYLLTEDQRTQLFHAHVDVTDILNGRTGIDVDTESFFTDWNAKLGRKVFGF